MWASWPRFLAGEENALSVVDTRLQTWPLTDSSWSGRERVSERERK